VLDGVSYSSVDQFCAVKEDDDCAPPSASASIHLHVVQGASDLTSTSSFIYALLS
jgi:hypothetical protein